jgi:hypothetical protein
MTTHRGDPGGIEIVELTADEYRAAIPGLTALLVDAVEGGAAVNFLAGVTDDEARAWWAARIAQVADGTISAFVARRRLAGGRQRRRRRHRRLDAPDRATRTRTAGRSPRSSSSLGAPGVSAGADGCRGGRALADGRWLLILDTEPQRRGLLPLLGCGKSAM